MDLNEYSINGGLIVLRMTGLSCFVGSEVLTAVTMKGTIFWNVMPFLQLKFIYVLEEE
jgi:hypothetical protein